MRLAPEPARGISRQAPSMPPMARRVHARDRGRGARRLGDDGVERLQPPGEALARAARAGARRGRRARLSRPARARRARCGGGKTGALGVVLGEALPYAFEDPAALEFLRGLAGAAARSGVALHLVPASGDEGDPALVLDAAVDAFVRLRAAGRPPAGRGAAAPRAADVVEGGPELPGCPLVAIDERAAAAAAARHVRELGHRRIGAISLPLGGRSRRPLPIAAGDVPRHRVTRERLQGYRARRAAFRRARRRSTTAPAASSRRVRCSTRRSRRPRCCA